MKETSPFRGARWVALVPLALAALAMAAPFAPPLAAFGIREFFAYVCHQEPARSFWLAGAPLAVCARCLGFYLGAALGAGFIRASRPRLLQGVAITLALNALDVALEFAGLYSNFLALRFVLGALLGGAIGALVAAWARSATPSRAAATASQ